jgi:hypothetical protein
MSQIGMGASRNSMAIKRRSVKLGAQAMQGLDGSVTCPSNKISFTRRRMSKQFDGTATGGGKHAAAVEHIKNTRFKF